MADLLLTVPSGEQALVASTAKTLLTAKAPANQRLKIKGIEVFGKGTSNTDTPIKIEIANITTDGQTGTATAVTPVAVDGEMGETAQGTYYKAYGTEPNTYGSIMRTWEMHPQTGLIVYFPLHDEIKLKGGTEIGVRFTASQSETVSVNLIVEE
jgi:hypothetical protein